MRSRVLVSVVVLFCSTAVAGRAQEAATLTGQILTAPDGQPLAGATV